MTKRAIVYGWVVVSVSALIVSAGMGTLFSLGVFLTVFLSSFAIGGAAALLALAFRPPRELPVMLAVAPTTR